MHGHLWKIVERILAPDNKTYFENVGYEINARNLEIANKGVEVIDLD